MNQDQELTLVNPSPVPAEIPSHQFTDSQGRVWSLVISIGDAKRIKTELKWDVMGVINGSALKQIANDPFMLCDIVWALIEKKASAAGIGPEDFLSALEGTSIDAMTSAFQQALINFFPSAQRRLLDAALRKMMTVQNSKVERMESMLEGDKMSSLIAKHLDSIEAEALKAAETEIAMTSGGSSSMKPPAS